MVFVFAVLASSAMLAFGYRLRLAFRGPSIDLYFYFVVATVGYGFVNWVGLPFFVHFSSMVPGQRLSSAILVFVGSAVPLVLVKLYLFASFLLGLLDRRVPRLWRRSYLVCSGFVVLATAILIARDLQGDSLDSLRPFLIALGISIVLADFLVIGHFLSQASQVQTETSREVALRIGWAYFIGFLLYSSAFYLSYWLEIPAVVSGTVPYLYYLMHFPPMLFLWRFCRDRSSGGPPLQDLATDLSTLVARFGLSERETDVLRLVLRGLTNKDVAERLFVSPHTVRNHIYSIYKKTGVKNRIQLLALCAGEG